jgi:hypothetical protein
LLIRGKGKCHHCRYPLIVCYCVLLVTPFGLICCCGFALDGARSRMEGGWLLLRAFTALSHKEDGSVVVVVVVVEVCGVSS